MKAAVRSVKNFSKGYSETQVKVRNATTNDAWGPSGKAMAEIAQLTFDQHEMLEVMDILDRRLNDKGKNWRHVFKGLTVLEYCIHSGSENVVRWAKDNLYIITTLREFVYIDENGTDQGQNIRTKAKELTNLLSDDEAIRQARRNRNDMHGRMNGDDEFGNSDDWGSRNRSRRYNHPPVYDHSSSRGSTRTQSRRNSPGDGSDGLDDELVADPELRRVIEESKRQAEIDARRRQEAENEEAELQKALQLSKEEEEARKRHEQETQRFMESNSYQPVDFFGNPVQPQQTGFSNNPFPIQPQQTGFVQPQATGFIQQQPTGFVQPQRTGFMQPNHTGFVQPQRTGFMPPNHTGFVQPQATGFVQPQATGFVQPQPTGFVQPQPTGFMQPQTTGFIQQQPTGFVQPQRTGFMQPNHTGFVQPQRTGFMQPNHTGYVQPQRTGVMQPQRTGFNNGFPAQAPIQQQVTGYVQPQRTGFGANNPYSQMMQPAPQPAAPKLEPTKTGSNNPFAQFTKLPQTVSAPNVSTSGAQVQRPVKTNDERYANIAQAVLTGNPTGVDTFGNMGDVRVPTHHTGSRFTNSAGQTIQAQPTGGNRNPFQKSQQQQQHPSFSQQPLQQANMQMPYQQHPMGYVNNQQIYGGMQHVPGQQPPTQPQVGSLIDL
ncbi:epsin [Schizosaccharomyces japonicus yFS275]|uniref:Epsin n=1 Tax=Schizosaccharomyces japonicus (strain yFS275 / FY16936) TaxID=402676 RepID=B6K7D6_SCHJY|nr:epsin [Schizosaccharomyces japonicus yFS275]EEB09440.1 epsin [Schizosaccharomyces japonicus yFS275]